MTSTTRKLLVEVLRQQQRLEEDIRRLKDANGELLSAIRMVTSGIGIEEYFEKQWDLISLNDGGECKWIRALDSFKKSCSKKK
jgi:hypothetical protein